jgi:hypothetical protein
MRTAIRVLALKVDLDWRVEASKQLYSRLRDLSWQAAHYRNSMIRRKWAEAMGYRVDPEAGDKHDITKQGRKRDKGELSGDAYSAAEQEVAGAWNRDAKRILAGQPLPEWKPTAALSVSGKEKRKDSGIAVTATDSGGYVLRLRAQSQNCEDGSWLTLPIAWRPGQDEYQGDLLRKMASWEIPVKKATVQMKPHKIIVRLTYKVEAPDLPAMGERVAVLGPVERDGRLMLRTETQERDYTSKLAVVTKRKDDWDLIRRRIMRQIGRRKHHARIKRTALARRFCMRDGPVASFEAWCYSYLHQWTRDVVDWCQSQGVGAIQVAPIATGDWPADRFTFLLKYKAEDAGMRLIEGAGLDAAGERAANALLRKEQAKVSRSRQAVRELRNQLA